MNRQAKKQIMQTHGVHAQDTGSAQVQVAILTARINQLSLHLQTHKKDKHSRQGLLKLVGARRRHLNYLKQKDKDQYEQLIQQLDLRK